MLNLELDGGQMVLGVQGGCPEPPLDNFTPGCNAPVPPPFPGSRNLTQIYSYSPQNPNPVLQRLYLSLLPPAQVRLWQVVASFSGDSPMTLRWSFSWKGPEPRQPFSLRLLDEQGFIDLRRPGSLALPAGSGRHTTSFVICSEVLVGPPACPQQWP